MSRYNEMNFTGITSRKSVGSYSIPQALEQGVPSVL